VADTPHDGSGTSVKFPTTATGYTVTNVQFNLSDPQAGDKIDISHLGLTAGAAQLSQDRPLGPSAADTGRELSFDYIGKTVIYDGTTGTLTVAGGLTMTVAATVLNSSVTLALNDVIRGSATLRVARV
jgi:hypothetical protein